MKIKNLRIALLSYRSNPYSGGQGIYVKFLSKALAEQGHKVDVFSGEPFPELDPKVRLKPVPGMNFYGYERARESIKDRGLHSWIDLFEFLSYTTGGFPEPFTFGARLLKKYEQDLKSYDLVHDNQSLCPALLTLQKLNIPLLTTVHHPITKDLRFALNHEPNWGIRLLIRRWHFFLKMQKRVARQLKKIVTVSQASKEDIAKDFGIKENKIHVIYNGVDLETFHPCPDISRQPLAIFATASADVPLKGLNYLLQALAFLKTEFPQIKLTVLGKPKNNGPTQQLISKLELKNQVKFISQVSTEKIVEEYARCSLAVIPSLYEGFGFPAVEAMACGVPVVSTTGGALPEVIGRAGLLVPPKNPHALSSAIKKILHDPGLAAHLAKQGLDRVTERFAWNKVAQQMTTLYKTIIQEHKGQILYLPKTDPANVLTQKKI